MSEQKQPFEGDHYLIDFMSDVIRKRGVKTVMETGTETGATAEAFSFMVPHVYTCDLEDKLDRELPEDVVMMLGESAECLDVWLPYPHHPILFFLDAHLAPKHTQILKELEVIAHQSLPDCVVVVHDFKTPHEHLGFDWYEEHGDLNLELIRPHLERIFPLGFEESYNNEAVGAMRGVGVFWAS
jgi:hypothetical protein